MADQTLPSIDPAQLAAITGGATSSDTNQQLQVALQSVMSSIKELAANRNNNNPLMQLLPMMMMMRGGQQAPPPPVQAPEPSPEEGWIRVR